MAVIMAGKMMRTDALKQGIQSRKFLVLKLGVCLLGDRSNFSVLSYEQLGRCPLCGTEIA
jgi:hypothetical protein